MRPKLLDLYCGAGGCAMGYHRAGFDVVGVDINDQPRYPFKFFRDDALEFAKATGHRFQAIHASPPCQAYSLLKNLSAAQHNRSLDGTYPDLLGPTRQLLETLGVPWVIENVVGAPMIRPVRFCGSFFALGVRRHRLFESSFRLNWTPWCRHRLIGRRPLAVYGDHPQGPGESAFRTKAMRINRASSLAEGSAAMGIDWMTWKELTQAIPPAYTEYIGKQFLQMTHF